MWGRFGGGPYCFVIDQQGCVCDVVVVVVVVVGKVVVVAEVYKGDLTDTIAEPIASGG